jgi:hypothetical protein
VWCAKPPEPARGNCGQECRRPHSHLDRSMSGEISRSSCFLFGWPLSQPWFTTTALHTTVRSSSLLLVSPSSMFLARGLATAARGASLGTCSACLPVVCVCVCVCVCLCLLVRVLCSASQVSSVVGPPGALAFWRGSVGGGFSLCLCVRMRVRGCERTHAGEELSEARGAPVARWWCE